MCFFNLTARGSTLKPRRMYADVQKSFQATRQQIYGTWSKQQSSRGNWQLVTTLEKIDLGRYLIEVKGYISKKILPQMHRSAKHPMHFYSMYAASELKLFNKDEAFTSQPIGH